MYGLDVMMIMIETKPNMVGLCYILRNILLHIATIYTGSYCEALFKAFLTVGMFQMMMMMMM